MDHKKKTDASLVLRGLWGLCLLGSEVVGCTVCHVTEPLALWSSALKRGMEKALAALRLFMRSLEEKQTRCEALCDANLFN